MPFAFALFFVSSLFVLRPLSIRIENSQRPARKGRRKPHLTGLPDSRRLQPHAQHQTNTWRVWWVWLWLWPVAHSNIRHSGVRARANGEWRIGTQQICPRRDTPAAEAGSAGSLTRTRVHLAYEEGRPELPLLPFQRVLLLRLEKLLLLPGNRLIRHRCAGGTAMSSLRPGGFDLDSGRLVFGGSRSFLNCRRQRLIRGGLNWLGCLVTTLDVALKFLDSCELATAFGKRAQLARLGTLRILLDASPVVDLEVVHRLPHFPGFLRLQ